ncbi:uncharacterized protein LOC120797295 [Xiphias gladius]|uniref:uncharacterized protein LOC120797295 n=1 Tax=Xiphias gladius TaxID=8245 RepID=UPI001A99DCC8|nr:uncharacterized protein LOC120797295 [Xiphias gladius]
MKGIGFFLALVHVFQHAEAVEVYEGTDSVVLPCAVHLSDFTNLSVVWRREDLSSSIVHYREQGTDRSDSQNRHYRDRTTVVEPQREKGLASLTLSKPRLNDSATYVCIIRRLGSNLNRTEVELLVKEPFPQMSSFLLGALVGAVGFLVGDFVVCFWRSKVAAFHSGSKGGLKKGSESVKLSYQSKAQLSEDATADCSFSDSEPPYQHCCDQPEKRRDIHLESLLQTGDLSPPPVAPTLSPQRRRHPLTESDGDPGSSYRMG